MTDEIKPCPFCGCRAYVIEESTCDGTLLYEVACDHDWCRGGYNHTGDINSWSGTREHAIELWNMRA